MKPVTGKDFAKALLKNGWVLDHVRGSHNYYTKDGESVIVCFPIHVGKTLKIGTQQKLMKDTGLVDADL